MVNLNGQKITIMLDNGYKTTERVKAITNIRTHDILVIGSMIKNMAMEDRFIQIWNMKETGFRVRGMD